MLRTGSQRRKLCPKSPVARVVDLLGDACSLLVMRDLLEKPQRFGALEDSLGGMSPRTLAKTLRRLEKDRLITRRHFNKPVRFHYELTPKGRAFQKVVDAMRAYGKRYL
ncbi:hypothetical protein A3A39_00085 [Candidatus Kaiserbacteria bacterium RIFCSPLOWO2_01_FULL_54_13]|uniref:HTH hxlR-type domain-containing protein n=1 Tax=Candidatus Kaiserbacteria bacterium RIFCSPLOWO2_01_FULL_54_13 TaxID=1798512 RepID=A0A1F6F4D4_9BACT|nr:MAG: hypothetical protein A3A39_00085 [Candidatus Kaiserbacteria bacterium RIFCSPLOWO2_01_FULL_54_13]